LLYVAATRAQDRLILSGTTKDLSKLGLKSDTWLNWIWQSLELPAQTQSGIIELDDDSENAVQLQLTVNLADEESVEDQEQRELREEGLAEKVEKNAQTASSMSESIAETFPLLHAIEPERDRAIHRFSVTQLINYQRCPRQYYFDRVLHAPAPDALAVWNDAEAPEPPANLTATLKGAVIHRFCETYSTKDNPEVLLRRSFGEVVQSRQAQLADRLVEINADEAIAELLPLAHNYLNSAVFERVERARSEPPELAGRPLSDPSVSAGGPFSGPHGKAGLWSELSFRLRRPLGILTGAIDKLLITPNADGEGFHIEIIDFKTNRLRSRSAAGSDSTSSLGSRASRPPIAEPISNPSNAMRTRRPRSQYSVGQIAFDFNAPVANKIETPRDELSLEERVRIAAADYQLQMQAYALAVGELMPSLLAASSSIKCTLHFLDPALEFQIDSHMLSKSACMHAIDDAMMSIVSSVAPGEFPVRPADHCRMCNFRSICPAGREWVLLTRPKAA
jgi:ATP-dependent exoDNAse (exonuclease V) beta subunit